MWVKIKSCYCMLMGIWNLLGWDFDRFEGAEFLEVFAESFSTFICHVLAASKKSKTSNVKNITDLQKLRSMDFKEQSCLKLLPIASRLSSVIFLHLWTSQETPHLPYVTYPERPRLMECKPLSFCRASHRLFTPSSVIPSQLLRNQESLNTKTVYFKVSLRDSNFLSSLRLAQRLFSPSSVTSLHLFKSK